MITLFLSIAFIHAICVHLLIPLRRLGRLRDISLIQYKTIYNITRCIIKLINNICGMAVTRDVFEAVI